MFSNSKPVVSGPKAGNQWDQVPQIGLCIFVGVMNLCDVSVFSRIIIVPYMKSIIYTYLS